MLDVSASSIPEKERPMDVLYICATGTSDHTRASIPFHLGMNGSVAEGEKIGFVLAGDAADLMIGNKADEVAGVGLPVLKELLAKVKEHSVPVYV
ncbi:MAG: hypothetical protein LC723_09550 [Actinobacteria bacterium]|nr:hypothetical protein [Actinomycetota bacterium]